ncbi:MAG: DUF134 domain-containing protein [Eubacteriales bacterium]|nr:DUF134 domain-containing protein [Eubacteriales bacterium]
MARPQKSRRICDVPASDRFIPVCGPSGGNPEDAADPSHAVILTIDEYEALRLIDHEGLTHSECAAQMNISRTTATEICESARRKVAEAIVSGRGLVITGGSWELCSGGREDCIREDCPRTGI